MTVDPFLLRGASLGAAWRADRGGAAGRRLPRGRRRPAADRVRACRSSPRCSISRRGSCPTRSADAASPVRAAAPRPAPARGGGRHRRQPGGGARGPPTAPPPGGPAPRRRPRAAGRRSRPRLGAIGRRRRRGARPARAERLGLPGPLSRLRRPLRRPARPRHACSARSPRSRPTGGPAGLAADVPWPPRVLLVGASPDDRAAIARAAARARRRRPPRYAPAARGPAVVAGLVRGARAVDPAGALGCGRARRPSRPSPRDAGRRVGRRGPARIWSGRPGILVEPRDADRLAVALRAVWADDRVHARIAAGCPRSRRGGRGRTWADVARETRAVYAEVGIRPA